MAIQERSVETTASPQAVWKIWSDAPTWQEWNPDVQSMTLNGPFAAGTTGTMKTKQGTRQIQLTEVVPGRSFRLETTVIPLTRFAFECQVAPGPAGKTTISQGIRVGGSTWQRGRRHDGQADR
jgi:Polyketide cyclase / dehydrase and lipid transport